MHTTTLLGCALAVAAQAPDIPQGGGACKDEFDCSLGGVCNATAQCVCDAWLTGPTCSLLNLVPPMSENQGLQPPGYYAWGGHALPDGKGMYHGLFSFMCRHATLGEWTTKSSIYHATAADPVGPFTLSDMVAQPWSHNAMLAENPEGGYLLWQIGDAAVDPSQWQPCYQSNASGIDSESDGSRGTRSGVASPVTSSDGSGIYVRSSPALTGPWTLENASGIELDVSGSWATGGANGGNPAPFFFPNGTALLYFSANPCPPGWGNASPGNNCIGVARAPSWRGPYSVAAANPLPVTHPESEDAFVFADTRGHFHLLTNVNNDHARCAQGVPCGGHAWSYDGLTFSNLTIGAFGPVIRFANGSYWNTAYVERPQVLQADDGTPLVFYVGMGRSAYEDSCNWAQAFCTPGAQGCGPTLPPPPPPPTLVRYTLGVGGRCLSVNASFPCPGGWATSCPAFLAAAGSADCAGPLSVWGERPDGSVESAAHPGAFLNVDCNGCSAHTLVKAIAVAADAAQVLFAGGQLTLPGRCGGTMCLNGGQGPAIPPCKAGEGYLPEAQLQLEACAAPDTQGWVRTLVPASPVPVPPGL